MITITKDNVLELLEQTIAAYGGAEVYYQDRIGELMNDKHVNYDCIYAVEKPNGSYAPGCLIGCLVVHQGVPAERFFDGTLTNNESAAGTLLRELKEQGLAEADEVAVDVLMVAQDAQDTGKTWGEALTRARETYTEKIEELESSNA